MNTNHYAAELNNLKGQKVRVEKGLDRKGLRKGDKGVITEVSFLPDAGFQCKFKVNGVERVMLAASIARFRGETISLNTGDPTQRVVLSKTA